MEHKELADIARILHKLSDDLRIANDRMDAVEQKVKQVETHVEGGKNGRIS